MYFKHEVFFSVNTCISIHQQPWMYLLFVYDISTAFLSGTVHGNLNYNNQY